ncbi:MAG: Polysaccharide deacetylase [uncultured Chloroflexia bacterium]|uniref:Polysaccharide deacetylase n=1 Tax=uncultured Chloroflexia bacterium TaxID=1672391 RepID=A0A6J4K4C1_9CHLR|nr:MAG: Polysaccharide deacetylase [uncultured Chloroflexia bacterium]
MHSIESINPDTTSPIEMSVIVIIPVDLHAFLECLLALCRQSQPAFGFEVIMVPVTSDVRAAALLQSLNTPFRLHVASPPQDGARDALRRASDVAAGQFCLVIDSAREVRHDLVAAHLRVQRETGGVVACGIEQAALQSDNPSGHQPPHRYRNGVSQQRAESASWWDSAEGHLSLPRAWLEAETAMPLLSEHHQGLELGYRLSQREMLRFVSAPDAGGKRTPPPALLRLVQEAEARGRESVALYHHYPALLAHLELGTFNQANFRKVQTRRLLLAARLPPRLLARIANAPRLPNSSNRWHRFLQSYSYWWGVRRALSNRDTWKRLTRGPVILMYHAIGGSDEPPGSYIVPQTRFARQMAWLKWNRYHVLGLDELLGYRRDYRLPPARSVVITFDDGYADNRSIAYPALRKNRFPATIFLVSRAVGATNDWDAKGELAGRPLLSWAEAGEMLRGGVQFGAHTRHHVSLTEVPAHQAVVEIAGSRSDLEHDLGVPVRAFAYPFGAHDRATQAAVEKAGFIGACCSLSGINDPLVPIYALRRVEVRGTDPPTRFVLALCWGRRHIR